MIHIILINMHFESFIADISNKIKQKGKIKTNR